jgi:hypothetical protein
MIEIIWENVKNLTPTSAECPKCGKIQEIDNKEWEMWKESPLTGKIMTPLCCSGFWAIWRRGYKEWWEFQVRGKQHVREPYGNSQRPVRTTTRRYGPDV